MLWSCYTLQVLLGTTSLKEFSILILLNSFRSFQEQFTQLQLFSKEQHLFPLQQNVDNVKSTGP